MSDHNGATTSPPKVVARNVAELARDAVTIAELQADLLMAELQDAWQFALPSIITIAASGLLLLGCVPVLLIGLGMLLAELSGLSVGGSILIVAAVAIVAGALVLYLQIKRLKENPIVLERSRQELRRNVNWLKQVLHLLTHITGGGRRSRTAEERAATDEVTH